MNTPFGPPWESVTLDDLVEFFEAAQEEGQTWEGKGAPIRSDHIRRAASGFGNSVLGGYLVLGVEGNRSKGTWAVGGWDPPGEATQWITDCLVGRVDPLPPFDVRSWELESGATVSVIRFWPAALPPCVTMEGQIFERVGSSTSQVKDAGSLHRLVDRGQEARRRAQAEAIDGRQAFHYMNPATRPHHISVTLGCVALASDISDLAFRKSVADGVAGALKTRLIVPALAPQLRTSVNQGGVTIWSESGFTSNEGYTVQVRRSGSVSAGWSDMDIESAVASVAASADRLERVWDVAATAVHLIGAKGPAHLSIRLLDKKGGPTDIDRWVDEPNRSGDAVDAVVREVKRVRGEWEWEPELPATLRSLGVESEE
jgi:hypothetical protein